VPAYMIVLPLEGQPSVHSTAMTYGEEQRLLEWLVRGDRQPWAALLRLAMELEADQESENRAA
jgi:hypothetical protein